MPPSARNHWLFSTLARVTGYSLLLLAIFDIIAALIPLQLFDPRWEYQTIGTIVEQVPVTLIGFFLAFYNGIQDRTRLERAFLGLLSFIALLAGVLFFLVMPLLISDSLRVNQQNYAQLAAQTTRQINQLTQLEQQISTIPATDLAEEAARLGLAAESTTSANPESLKARLLTELSTRKQQVNQSLASSGQSQRFSLIRTTVKWLLGALVSGIVLLYTWSITQRMLKLSLSRPEL